MTEYRFPKDGWELVREKRDWVPELMFKAIKHVVFLFPLNLILTKKVEK
jgi:hypothetical protein